MRSDTHRNEPCGEEIVSNIVMVMGASSRGFVRMLRLLFNLLSSNSALCIS